MDHAREDDRTTAVRCDTLLLLIAGRILLMPQDLVSFTIAVVLICVGLWGMVGPKSLSQMLRDQDDESDLLNSNPSSRLQFAIRVAGIVLVACGVCLGIASLVGVNNPPGFDPNVF